MPSAIVVLSRSPALAPLFSQPSRTANIWLKENLVSSGGQVHEIPLRGLPEWAPELKGTYAHVTGQARLGGSFLHPPFATPGTTVTQDPFDQGVVYLGLHSAMEYLEYLGFNMRGILGGKHGGVFHPTIAFVNTVSDLNAWYSPNNETLTFGRGQEKWHLGSCLNVVHHEWGHLLLDHMQPGFVGMSQREAGAIHEGFGDALSSFLADDPELSEDALLVLGGKPSADQGMRTVANALRLADVGSEVHDRGLVYGGALWSIKGEVEEHLPRSQRVAADLGLKLLLNHAAHYQTARPRPADFVDALLSGAKSMIDAGYSEIPYSLLQEIIVREALKRGLQGREDPARPLYLPAICSVADAFGGEGVLHFQKVSRVPYLGGHQERHQQYYQTSHGLVPVLARGFYVNFPLRHHRPLVAVKDVRRMSAGEIDETLSISLEEALERIQKRLALEKRRMERDWELLPESPVSAEDVKRVRMASMNRTVIERALQEFQERGEEMVRRGVGVEVALVILPNGKTLVYAFTFGEAVFYVDAKSGRVSLQQEVFI